MNDADMTDEEYLAAVRKAREESVRFFSPKNRRERELWVANEFLTNLGITFDQSELVHIKDDPPDVKFRAANFEIKEILDEGRRRHAKASLERAYVATSPSELLSDVTPRDITYTEVCALIEARVDELATKYAPDARGQMDLLFYVNLDNVYGYVSTPLPSLKRLRQTGFRSVSLVIGRLSGVLMFTEAAPEFLRKDGVRIIRRPKSDG